MARTDQPYLPLYVDDWMNNNKLKLCSPASHGIMIAIMCLMHKESEHYGKLLLKQKYKQTDKQIHNFALQLARQTSFDLVDVEAGLTELLEEKVLILDEDFLICVRMVRDADLSLKRSKSGSDGGKTTQNKAKQFALANSEANDEANAGIGIGNNSTDSDIGKEGGKKLDSNQHEEVEVPVVDEAMISPKMIAVFKRINPDYQIDLQNDYRHCREISYKIARLHGWTKESVTNENMGKCLIYWECVAQFMRGDSHYSNYSLHLVNKHWPALTLKKSNTEKNGTANRKITGSDKSAYAKSTSATDALKGFSITGSGSIGAQAGQGLQ